MYNEFRIVVFAINQSGGNSENITRKADEQEAIIKFHDMCSSYGSNAQVRKATVMLFDADGGLVRKEEFIHEQIAE